MKSLTILFWNVGKQHRSDLISRLAKRVDADVIILAESAAEKGPLRQAICDALAATYVEAETRTPRLQVYARESLGMHEVHGVLNGRMSIRALRFDSVEFLVAAVHLPSKRNWDPASQAAESCALADQIRATESRRGHTRTILIGDLNMNPFEDAVVQAKGFHGIMTKDIVVTESRTVQGVDYPFFYNPMWGHFGDRTSGPPGTFYYRHSGHVSYEWNMFDQVLLRAAVLPWFRDEVEIVSRIGQTSLLSLSGRPDPKVGSDHFPLVVRLTVPL